MEEYSVIGKRLPLKDSVEKATGMATFTSDFKLPGMLYARILRSPYPHARILNVDTSKAERLPGIKAILCKNNMPSRKLPVMFGEPGDKYAFGDKVRYVGEEVAAVAADSEEAAEEALRLIEINYEKLPPIFDPEEAIKTGSPLVHDDKPGNIACPIVMEFGEVEKGFNQADYLFEETFRTQCQSHGCLETHCCVADFSPSGNLTLWVSHQAPLALQELLVKYLDIPASKIRIIKPHVGGGFGSKLDMLVEHICALLSLMTGHPVKLVYSREEEFSSTLVRHSNLIKLKIGTRKDGTLTALQAYVLNNEGAYMYKRSVLVVLAATITKSYRCPNVKFEGYSVYTNRQCSGPMRGYGHPQAAFALESMMDIIANRLGIDPVDFRLKNFRGIGDQAMSGKLITTCGLPECLNEGADIIGWMKRGKQVEGSKKKRGIGVACFAHNTGTTPGKQRDYSTAIVKLNTDGTAVLITGATDLGTGCNTTLAQIVAEEFGLNVNEVAVVAGDTNSVPYDSGAFASRTLYMNGLAIRAAVADIKQHLIQRASELLSVECADLCIQGNIIYARLDPGKMLTISEIAKETGENLEGKAQNFLGKASRINPGFGQSFGAQFAEVEVDIETGEVTVLKIVAVHDVGKAINPMVVEGQIEGAIQQMIGYTLTENMAIDHNSGEVLSNNFDKYRLLTTLDMPETEVKLVETYEPSGPFGAKGMAESPTEGIAPAIANAIYNAVGIRLKELPITAEDVLNALRHQVTCPPKTGHN